MKNSETPNNKKEDKETIDIIICPECDGSGYTNKGKCKICKGTGEIK